MKSDVLIGAGKSTGMFFTAPAGTALPAYPGETLGASWAEVGDISEDGISLKLPSGDVLRNWALQPKRKINTENGAVSGAIMETTKKVLETLFGSDNVNHVAATAQHGNVDSVELSPDVSAEEAAYLFLIKDGDSLVMIGSSNALITEIADVSFNGTSAVVYDTTIEGTWTYMIDDGAVTS